MVFAIISSLSITSQLLLALAHARTSVTRQVGLLIFQLWNEKLIDKNQQKYFLRASQVCFSTTIFLFYQNWNWVNHIIFSVEVSKTRITKKRHLIFLFKPIPTGTGGISPYMSIM